MPVLTRLTRPTPRCLLPIAMAVAVLFGCGDASTREEPDETEPARDFQLSDLADPDTIEKPRWPDGSIDYVAWLNQVAGHGVTVENNEFSISLQVFGPVAPEVMPRRAFGKLERLVGVRVPEDRESFHVPTRYFEELTDTDDECQAKLDAFWEQIDITRKRPWRPDEAPLVHAWVERNGEHLDQLVEASARLRSYMPLVSVRREDEPYLGPMISCVVPHLDRYRAAARALVARGLLRWQSGDHEKAIADIRAVARLGRLLTQRMTMVEQLVGISIEGFALETIDGLLKQHALTPAQAAELAKMIGALPPAVGVGRVLDLSERASQHATFDYLSREGTFADLLWVTDVIGRAAGSPRSDVRSPLAMLPLNFDPAPVHRQWDLMIDEALKIWQAKTPAEAKAALEAFSQYHTKIVNESSQRWRVLATEADAERFRELPAAERRKLMTPVMEMALPAIMTPTLNRFYHNDSRRDVAVALTTIALRLEQYRGRHGQYPDSLDELREKLGVALPDDPYAMAPPRYRRTAEGGFVLYSVGENLVDDDGWDLADIKWGTSD